MDSFSLIVAFSALVWTGYQEIRMFKMCKNCPYFTKNKNKKLPAAA